MYNVQWSMLSIKLGYYLMSTYYTCHRIGLSVVDTKPPSKFHSLWTIFNRNCQPIRLQHANFYTRITPINEQTDGAHTFKYSFKMGIWKYQKSIGKWFFLTMSHAIIHVYINLRKYNLIIIPLDSEFQHKFAWSVLVMWADGLIHLE